VVSPAIVAEYLDVLTRPSLARKFRVIATRDFAAVLRIVGNATVVLPSHTPAVCRDPEDDKFLAAAMLGGAAFIVSEDADLLDLQSYEGVAILSAEHFLRMLNESAHSSQ
jgi:putative PIN family toxin of toxin-antitoxin system